MLAYGLEGSTRHWAVISQIGHTSSKLVVAPIPRVSVDYFNDIVAASAGVGAAVNNTVVSVTGTVADSIAAAADTTTVVGAIGTVADSITVTIAVAVGDRYNRA